MPSSTASTISTHLATALFRSKRNWMARRPGIRSSIRINSIPATTSSSTPRCRLPRGDDSPRARCWTFLAGLGARESRRPRVCLTWSRRRRERRRRDEGLFGRHLAGDDVLLVLMLGRLRVAGLRRVRGLLWLGRLAGAAEDDRRVDRGARAELARAEAGRAGEAGRDVREQMLPRGRSSLTHSLPHPANFLP